MPKIAKELSPLEVRRLTKPGRYAVGGVRGLILNVGSSGARSWVLRMVIGDQRRESGLGPFPEIGLGEARNRAREFRKAVEEGRDPVAEKRAAKRQLIRAQQRSISFEQAARRHHRMKVAEFRSSKHQRDWINSLSMHAFPHIGSIPVSEIDIEHIMLVLEPIWLVKTETATRVRQRIEAVLDWAKVSKFREGENPAAWQGNLETKLQAPGKVRKVAHFPALPYQRVGHFMVDLRKREGTGARALEFAILTACRSREVRLSTWDEISLSEAVWTIPAARMKADKAHQIPLNEQAQKVLHAMAAFGTDGLIFQSAAGSPISDATILAVIKRMHADELKNCREGWIDPTDGRRIVPHGFRSTFKDWSRNLTRFPDEVSELALAHVNDDKTRAAYARDGLLPARTKLMRAWGQFASERFPETTPTSLNWKSA